MPVIFGSKDYNRDEGRILDITKKSRRGRVFIKLSYILEAWELENCKHHEMPLSKKRKIGKKKKPQRKRYKPYEAVKYNMYSFSNPFPTDIPFEDRLGVFLELAEKSTEEFEAEYLKLMEYFKEYDALYLCSFCVFYFLAHEPGVDAEAIDGKLDFPPFFLEILQALSLFQERNLSPAPLANGVLKFKETVQKLNRGQSFRYYKLSENVKTVEELHPILLRMEMMLQTLAVRNWAFEAQMRKIAYDLATTVDGKFKEKMGFSPILFLDILFGLTELTNERLTAHQKKLRAFITAKTYQAMFDAYETQFPNVESLSGDLRKKMWEMCDKNMMALKSIMLQHAELVLSDIFSYQIGDLRKLTNITVTDAELSNIFDRLSYGFGDLADFNKDFVFLNNPIHSRPFIKYDDKYFCAIPHLFSQLGVDLLEKFVDENKDLQKIYFVKKGRYLEIAIETLFRDAFPDAKIFSGGLWKCPTSGKDYENDLIVLIEDFAIIVEAKSGRVTPHAKRGAPNRLFGTLKELVVEPSEQAIRFERYLRDNPFAHKFHNKQGERFEIDSSKIKYYVPLGVTLSSLGSIGCNLKKLIEAGVITNSLDDLAPSITLTDLEVIFELLPLQAEKIHYLTRRREFEAHIGFQGDEMDLFSFYLETGFNIGETEFDTTQHMILTMKSKEIDPYFVGREQGVFVKKPYLQKTKYWENILNELNNRGPSWLQASYILLNVAYEDQVIFEKKVDELKGLILKGKCKKPHNWVLLRCGAESRRFAVVGFPYLNIDTDTRNDVIGQIVDSEADKNLRGIVILGFDLSNPRFPYSVVAGSLNSTLLDKIQL
jgi:hypothetical protein